MAKSLYSVHPGFAREAASMVNLVRKTGKTIDEWVEIVKRTGPPTEKERREWLKATHGLTTNYAWWVAERAEGKGRVEDYDPEALVEAMYTGSKAALLPIYDALLRLGLGLGDDVKACPCQTMVPFYRTHVFAQIKPSTRTRIDLGFALADTEPSGRLVAAGGLQKGDRITHRIPVTSLADVNDEVRHWFRVAYDLNP